MRPFFWVHVVTTTHTVMPRGSRRRSGSKSPKRRRGSRAARKSPRRSRSPKRSPRRFRGVEDERAYGRSDRDLKVDRFKTEFGKVKFTPGSQPFLKLFAFHACVNADELLKKDSEASERLLNVLDSIGKEIGFSKESDQKLKFSYAKHMQEIGVRTNYVTGTRLRTHVAEIMAEKLGEDDMVEVINSLMTTVHGVVKEIEQVMGYTSFKEAKLIQEYKKLETLTEGVRPELAKKHPEVPDVKKVSKELMKGLQELKRFHKAIFLRMFGPERLRMLQDEIAEDADLDKVVPKILARFAHVPKLSKIPAPGEPAPVVPAISVASNDVNPAIPMAEPVAGPADPTLPMATPLPDPDPPMATLV